MTNDTITRSEAVDRMRAGLPCETFCPGWGENDGWDATKWADFDDEDPECKFRIPPEPRREAREWRRVTGLCFSDDHPVNLVRPIHVREVLPDEVVLRRMTEAEAQQDFHSVAFKKGYYNTSWNEEEARHWWLASRRALGLIGEEGK